MSKTSLFSSEKKDNDRTIIPLKIGSCNKGEKIFFTENVLCPLCNKTGQHVKSITVKHLIKQELMDRLGVEDYFLCMNPGCDAAYYSATGTVFEKSDITVPLWFKDDAEPKYACYCSEITEEQVIRAMIEQGMTDMATIKKLYDPGAKCQCHLKNPTGKCCTEVFTKAIDKGIILETTKKM
ncbi:BFD-like (2Fe-2S) protein [Methanomethylovorans hollandica DSM 15978]|uniref:BFD-like (2Fe-2S) protein n=1 Tax=Methanomethylovorans hollandica (strain DSM 15978 / NBRC 107637 / DMS1) TaxID=867904 RepID=L0L2A0_METHD|nr:copper chaperone Copz family protein [Methanomethylovorans hollandica]AGB50404.1 BFD-like (2Fe-2S) protein [Methanomethylovorans hollandica DSM 15978]